MLDAVSSVFQLNFFEELYSAMLSALHHDVKLNMWFLTHVEVTTRVLIVTSHELLLKLAYLKRQDPKPAASSRFLDTSPTFSPRGFVRRAAWRGAGH